MTSTKLIAILYLLSLIHCGCTGLYFRDAGRPPERAVYSLSKYPAVDYWTGIVFNGAKIGFSHFTFTPSPALKDTFIVKSDAYLRFRFLGIDKEIILKSEDQVAGNMALQKFRYFFDLDDSHLEIWGRVHADRLEVNIKSAGQENSLNIPLQESIYPSSMINVIPVIQGLEIGRNYNYLVFDGQTQTIERVEQKIVAYEESDLFEGQAYRLKTDFHGQQVTGWIDSHGYPRLELSHGGVILSTLENKKTAMHYLTQAALNKNEVLLGFGLIKIKPPLVDPNLMDMLELYITGIDKLPVLWSDERQTCKPASYGFICRIQADHRLNHRNSTHPTDRLQLNRYLESSFVVPSNHPDIQRQAHRIASGSRDPKDQIERLTTWLQHNIRKEASDVFSALDVLNNRKAECQGHSYLFAAFSRALNIPTRIVNGIVYSTQHQGFLYHTWVECFWNNRWVAVDPTFHQVPADATHVKFLEGEHMSDLLPLAGMIGKIKIRVMSFNHMDEGSFLNLFN